MPCEIEVSSVSCWTLNCLFSGQESRGLDAFHKIQPIGCEEFVCNLVNSGNFVSF